MARGAPLISSLLTRLYDPLFERPLRGVRALVLDVAAQLAPRRVLDVCSGTGTQVLALRRAGFAAWGADLSPEMLAQARRRLPADASPLQNAKALAYRDGAFDLAVASLALHEKREDTAQAMVCEMLRVTRPGGHVLLVDYAARTDIAPLPRAVTFGVERLVGGNHYRNYRAFLGRGGLDALLPTPAPEIADRRPILGNAVEGLLLQR